MVEVYCEEGKSISVTKAVVQVGLTHFPDSVLLVCIYCVVTRVLILKLRESLFPGFLPCVLRIQSLCYVVLHLEFFVRIILESYSVVLFR